MVDGQQYRFMSTAKEKKGTFIIVQARMGSTRLPGKILKEVMGRPLLGYQIERLKKINHVDDVIIATTTNPSDDRVVGLCKDINCSYFRGSEDDVLLRYHETAIEFCAKKIIRINADCPLIDPKVVERIIKYFNVNSDKFDYVSNILEPSYPIGLHTEMFSIDALQKANENTDDLIEREHVTPYIYRNPDLFRLGSVVLDDNLCHFRWTVDYPEDFILIKNIIEGIYPINVDFDMLDIITYLQSNPRLMRINNQIIQKQTL
jgi:spore coat polysaccharide biosynthesis protein SpsF